MFAVKNYQQGLQRLLAACDEDLLGSRHQEGDLQIEVSEPFYDGMRVDEESLRSYLRGCTLANLVGPHTVGVAVDMGLVEDSHVLRIDGVPHAQLLVMFE